MMPPAPNAAANHAVVAFVVLTGASVAVMLPRVRRALEQLPDARPTTPGALPPEVEHRE